LEWDEIKKHPVVSYEIVKQIDFLKDGAIAILYHHERVDGKGYPFGKKDEDLPLTAKILGVADAFDAMSTDRPYRRARTLEESIVELEKNKGTQFDEKICDIMIDFLRRRNIDPASYSLDERED